MRSMVLMALLAAACASAEPAPISYGRGAAAPQRTEQRPARVERRETQPQPPPRAPIVQAQPNWADGEGRPLSAYATQADSFDPASAPRTHRVSGDEQLYDIATRYHVPMLSLIEQNHLEPPYSLRAGQDIQLPPPRFHVVRRGEDIRAIAQRYNVDPRSLALFNRIELDAAVRAGERIYLPAIAQEAAPAAPPTPVVPLPAGSGRFAWPLRGDVVTRFGVQPGGTRIDGIEIAGREGAQVSAAADGDVIYAGSDIEGLGVLILVRHADNYVTAYGNNGSAQVREGQHVRAGQAIAELGARPDGRARLLFQVRRGNEALDPAPLMAALR